MLLLLGSVRCIIADVLYILSGEPIKVLIDMDVKRNMKWDAKKDVIRSKLLKLNYLLLKEKEFRSIFYFRERHHRFLCTISRFFLPDINTIEFGGGAIGGGLMISHYHCVIYPKETGNNFRVGPGVVIGRNGGFPKFGDNVYIAANSTVIGDIEIGSNVIVGAGSVVTKSLAGNGVYFGNPARKVKDLTEDSPLWVEIC